MQDMHLVLGEIHISSFNGKISRRLGGLARAAEARIIVDVDPKSLSGRIRFSAIVPCAFHLSVFEFSAHVIDI